MLSAERRIEHRFALFHSGNYMNAFYTHRLDYVEGLSFYIVYMDNEVMAKSASVLIKL